MSNQENYVFPKREGVDPSSYIDVYQMLKNCSQAHTPRSFSMTLLDLLERACPYDQAIVFFVDVNGKVSGRYSRGVNQKWLNSYFEYYLALKNTPDSDLSIYQNINENTFEGNFRILDWHTYPKSAFVREYIRPQNLKYSMGFCFYDLNGAYRVVFALDRKRDVPFSREEQNRMNLALPILNNMHRNFFYHGIDTKQEGLQSSWQKYSFTERELEIANLICQGASVASISSVLYIAVTTTYKHMAHIYEKVGVSSRQELMAKLMNEQT